MNEERNQSVGLTLNLLAALMAAFEMEAIGLASPKVAYAVPIYL